MRPSFYIRAGKKRYASFSFFASAGSMAAILLALTLGVCKNLSLNEVLILLLISFANVLMFYSLHYVLTGSKALTFYRYQLFVILCNSCFIYAVEFSNPLAFIDLTIICIGGFHCLGRIGCFHAGCCHGRPARVGVIYDHDAHKKHGFPQPYFGIKLIPIQLISAGCIFTLVGTSIGLFLNPTLSPGSATVWYISGYALCRFILEFFRGDTDRKFFGAISEAQFTAFASCLIVVSLQYTALLPSSIISTIICILLFVAIVFLSGISFIPAFSATGFLFKPETQVELYHCLQSLKERKSSATSFESTHPIVVNTSFGWAFSMQELPSETKSVLYTISSYTTKLNSRFIRFFLFHTNLRQHPNASYKLLKQSDHLAQILMEGNNFPS
jgi:hypothetical protein